MRQCVTSLVVVLKSIVSRALYIWEVFLKSQFLPAYSCSHKSPVRWGTAVRIWTACFCVLWPPLGSRVWLCVTADRRPLLCLIGLGRNWMTQLFAGAQWRPTGILLVPNWLSAETSHWENIPPIQLHLPNLLLFTKNKNYHSSPSCFTLSLLII